MQQTDSADEDGEDDDDDDDDDTRSGRRSSLGMQQHGSNGRNGNPKDKINGYSFIRIISLLSLTRTQCKDSKERSQPCVNILKSPNQYS